MTHIFFLFLVVAHTSFVFSTVLAREFTTSPNNVTAVAGDPVRFHCEIESVPEAEITWEKDGSPIESAVTEDNYVNGSRFVMLKSGVLHIYQVEASDAGNYR